MDAKEEKQKKEEKNKQGGEQQEGENVESTKDEKNHPRAARGSLPEALEALVQASNQIVTNHQRMVNEIINEPGLLEEIGEATEWLINLASTRGEHLCEEVIRAEVEAIQEELAGCDAAYTARLRLLAAMPQEEIRARTAGSDAACSSTDNASS